MSSFDIGPHIKKPSWTVGSLFDTTFKFDLLKGLNLPKIKISDLIDVGDQAAKDFVNIVKGLYERGVDLLN
jgi:hypothetical protein